MEMAVSATRASVAVTIAAMLAAASKEPNTCVVFVPAVVSRFRNQFGELGPPSVRLLVSARTVPESFAQGSGVAGPWWVVVSTTSTATSTVSPPLRSRTLRAPTGAATLASGLAGLTATAVSVGWVACRARHAVHTRMARALQLLTCQQATSQQVVVCTTTTVPGTGRLPSKHPCQWATVRGGATWVSVLVGSPATCVGAAQPPPRDSSASLASLATATGTTCSARVAML